MRWLLVLALAALPSAGLTFDHEPLRFVPNGDEIVLIGDIDRRSLRRFKRVTRANPEIKTLVLEWIGGSVDDEANVKLSRAIHSGGFTTLVPSDGMIASGGTDLFLAGQNRILEPGACVGVHSWAAGDGREGIDLPRNAPEHQIYLRYYRDIGIPQGFYWFTLDAAPAAGMHWMTAREVASFGLSTARVPRLGNSAECNRR